MGILIASGSRWERLRKTSVLYWHWPTACRTWAMCDHKPIVTIDGPSGGGKSTVSRALAARLGFTYLDTGAMYRAVAYTCQEQGVDPLNAVQLESVSYTHLRAHE